MGVSSVVNGSLFEEVTFKRRPAWMKESFKRIQQHVQRPCGEHKTDTFEEQQGGYVVWGAEGERGRCRAKMRDRPHGLLRGGLADCGRTPNVVLWNV